MPRHFECSITSIEVSNLRGFRRAKLDLNRDLTLLVGPNNSGKTSLLRLLEWTMNGADFRLLGGQRDLTPAEREFLTPARNARGTARRVTLGVHIPDGRRARRFTARGNSALLRLNVVGSSVYAAVGQPARGERRESTAKALELAENLRGCTEVVLIPAVRHADSERFSSTLELAIRARLSERGLHEERGGAPAEYRAISRALRDIVEVSSYLLNGMWDDLDVQLPTGLVDSGEIRTEPSPSDLVDWLARHARLSVSTGPHDARTVPPREVGSGLQSLLDLALLEAGDALNEHTILCMEEPEAFLHPAAQRVLAQQLFAERPYRRIISTHSPVLIDEASYGDVLLMRNHVVFAPAIVERKRDAINSALLTGQGSEAIYSRSVLFVEGPGDRAFFEALRRRIASVDPSGLANALGVVAVGGKTRFGPWVGLCESYRDPQQQKAIGWLVAADSCDACADVARGVRDGGVRVPEHLRQSLNDIGAAFGSDDIDSGLKRSGDFNDRAEAEAFPVVLLPGDLEHTIVSAMSNGTAARLAKGVGIEATTEGELRAALGSKVIPESSRSSCKDPWMRGQLGREIPWSELSEGALSVVRRWMLPTFANVEEVDRVLDRMV